MKQFMLEETSLEGDIDLVAPFLSGALVPAAHLDSVKAAARLFPPADAGFECRLGRRPEHTDFAIAFNAHDGRREIFAAIDLEGDVPQHFESPNARAWTNLLRFCREWAQPGSLLHSSVKRLWFEFDQEPTARVAPIPRSFISCRDWNPYSGDRRSPKKRTEEALTAIHRILEVLYGCSPGEDLLGFIRGFLFSLPHNARLGNIGTVLGPRPESVRLEVVNLSAQQIVETLATFGWPVPSDVMRSIVSPLSPLAARITLALDVGNGPTPKVGLIPSYHKIAQPLTEPRWYSLLSHLVAGGLCTSEEREALLRWPGVTAYRGGDAFPRQEGLPTADALGIVPRWILARLLSHVKIDCLADGSCEAKAYFGFIHRCIPLNSPGD